MPMSILYVCVSTCDLAGVPACAVGLVSVKADYEVAFGNEKCNIVLLFQFPPLLVDKLN